MKVNYSRLLWLLIALVLLIYSVRGFAQGIVTGSISGTVEDPSSAVIVGATNTSHLQRNRLVGSLQLDDHDYRSIRQVTQWRVGPHGEVYGLERDRDGRHGRIMKYNLNR